jgi:hypothetical protein
MPARRKSRMASTNSRVEALRRRPPGSASGKQRRDQCPLPVRQIGRVGAPSPLLACHRAGSRSKPTSDEARKPSQGNPLLKRPLRQGGNNLFEGWKP